MSSGMVWLGQLHICTLTCLPDRGKREVVPRLHIIIENKKLIEKRETIQKEIDNWHIKNKGKNFDKDEYIKFLKSISYIANETNDFTIETSNVDQEITSIAGPQLVVPVDNARYALNAANARWGSLYDALYGTDVISGDIGKTWDKESAKKVIEFVRKFLDESFPLSEGSWKSISNIQIDKNELVLLINTLIN